MKPLDQAIRNAFLEEARRRGVAGEGGLGLREVKPVLPRILRQVLSRSYRPGELAVVLAQAGL